MKRMTVILCIWAVIMITAILGLVYLGELKNDILSYIDTVYESDNKDEKLRYSSLIQERWEKGSKVIRIFVRHNEIDEMLKLNSALKAFAENDENGDFHATLVQMRALIIHIYDNEIPLPGSIF